MKHSLPLLALLAAGCGNVALDDDSSSPTGSQAASCDDGGSVDTYVAGLSLASASGFEVTLVSADPAPPDVGFNTFIFDIKNADGSPADGTSLLITPWMPLHGHGSSPPTYDAPDEGGVWAPDSIDLFMPGLWEINVDLVDGDLTDNVMFRFCLEG